MTSIITTSDLIGRSLADLHVLYHQLQVQLAQAQPGTVAHRDAVASLDVIRRAIRLKQQALAPRF